MSRPVLDALSQLLDEYIEVYQRSHAALPRAGFDPQWRSDCEIDPPHPDGTISWRPSRRAVEPDFSGIERALEVTIHTDIKDYFSAFYSDNIPARSADGGVDLIQIWNDADFDRLVENWIGHALNKRRSGHELTLFFAVTDEDAYFLTVHNHTGAVWVETPGLPPVRCIASDLAAFLGTLTPLAEVAERD